MLNVKKFLIFGVVCLIGIMVGIPMIVTAQVVTTPPPTFTPTPTPTPTLTPTPTPLPDPCSRTYVGEWEEYDDDVLCIYGKCYTKKHYLQFVYSDVYPELQIVCSVNDKIKYWPGGNCGCTPTPVSSPTLTPPPDPCSITYEGEFEDPAVD